MKRNKRKGEQSSGRIQRRLPPYVANSDGQDPTVEVDFFSMFDYFVLLKIMIIIYFITI